MVQVSYPGVYIQEVKSDVHTITGVSTSVAAFFGRAADGPINKAVRCFSLADFVRNFAGPHEKSELARSVTMFFENGGSDCYVVRLAPGASKATMLLKTLVNGVLLRARAKTEGDWGNTLRLTVDYNTGVPDERFNLRVLAMRGGKSVSEDFYNLSMDPSDTLYASTYVTQNSKLIDLDVVDNGIQGVDPGAKTGEPATKDSYRGYSESLYPFDCQVADTLPEGQSYDSMDATEIARKLDGIIFGAAEGGENTNGKFVISVNNGPDVLVDLAIGGRFSQSGPPAENTVDKLQTEIGMRITNALQSSPQSARAGTIRCELKKSPNTPYDSNSRRYYLYRLRIIADDGATYKSVRIKSGPAGDAAAALMLGVENGGIEWTRYSAFRPVPTATMLPLKPEDITLLMGLKQNFFDTVKINGTVVSLKDASDKNTLVSGTGANDGGELWFKGPDNGKDGVRNKLRIIADAINAKADLGYTATLWGSHLAIVPDSDDYNDKADVVTYLSSSPTTARTGNIGTGATRDYITENVRFYVPLANGTSPYQDRPAGVALEGRNDDGSPLTVENYKGDADLRTGFHALDAVDLFNLMVLPGDRDLTKDDFLALWGAASGYCLGHRAFLLMDSPDDWARDGLKKVSLAEVQQVRNAVVQESSAVFYPKIQYMDQGGTRRFIGPSGAIAGLMARIDASRGVWKAPAGIEATIRGALDLEVNLTDPENGELNLLGVNCLRLFPNGIVNWGARTAAGYSTNSETDWRYIPIRRLALFLEESLYRGTKWVVFEPNDEPLWAKIRQNLGAFMMGLFRQGAFQGSTPDKAFYVKCDGETTTQDDRNNGIVNIEVGFAPLKPAEFVVIKIQQMAGEL